jgi:SAM-dependent methyltransferase
LAEVWCHERTTVAHPGKATATSTSEGIVEKMRERVNVSEEHLRHDYFPTPRQVVDSAISLIAVDRVFSRALDPGAGDTGVWGAAIRAFFPHTHLVGVEIRDVSEPPVGYDEWHRATNFLDWTSDQGFDLIAMNPPFKNNLPEKFTQHALRLLRPDGVLVSLQRIGTLAGIGRYTRLYAHTQPWLVAILVQRPSFTGNGKTDMGQEYAVFYWRNGYQEPPGLTWLDWKRTHTNDTTVMQLPLDL